MILFPRQTAEPQRKRKKDLFLYKQKLCVFESLREKRFCSRAKSLSRRGRERNYFFKTDKNFASSRLCGKKIVPAPSRRAAGEEKERLIFYE
jgi:hypothetical protein